MTDLITLYNEMLRARQEAEKERQSRLLSVYDVIDAIDEVNRTNFLGRILNAVDLLRAGHGQEARAIAEAVQSCDWHRTEDSQLVEIAQDIMDSVDNDEYYLAEHEDYLSDMRLFFESTRNMLVPFVGEESAARLTNHVMAMTHGGGWGLMEIEEFIAALTAKR